VTLTLLAMFGVPAPIARSAAEAAMESFVAAVKERDRRKVASFFAGQVTFLNTLERPYQRATIDCRRAGELEDLLFGDDGLRDYVVLSGRRPWRRKGAATFLPPYRTGLRIHVRWRRESDRLLVQEIAFPSE
jgi:hypothetical protein